MSRACLLVLLIVPLAFSSSAQKIPLIHSGELLDAAKVLYDSGHYELALEQYEKVPERDTNYVYMLTEAALTQIAAEQYDDVLKRCEKGLAKPSEYTPYFLRYQAIAEDKKGNFERSIELFNAAVTRYPADYGLWYNLGVTYYNNGHHEKAADIFFKVLSINAFHAGSHLNLARIAIGHGRKVHGMLSLGIYLSIITNDNPRLVLLNNFVDNQVTDEGSIPVFGLNEAEKVDQIIRAKLALDKRFKSAIPIDAPVVRQYEMLFQQLDMIGTNAEDPWVKTYLPIYRLIREQKFSEAFIYHLLSSSANQVAKKWLGKNEKTLNSFYSAVNTEIKKQRDVVSLAQFGYPAPIQAWYNDDNTMVAVGEFTTEEVRRGRWKFFYKNYQMSAEGNFDDSGKKTGKWTYYNNDGTVRSVEDYQTGEVTVFYPDGARREHFFLKDGEIHGSVDLFHACGPTREKLAYENGKRHGKGEKFYAEGSVEMSYEYRDHKAEGEFRFYFPGGQLKSVEPYQGDVLSGEFQSYFPNGVLESKGNYVKGKMVGEWVHYYSNGRVARRGSYNDAGYALGEWQYFDEDGFLTERRPFDGEGHLHGANSHYVQNKPYFTANYIKGVITETVFYNRDGKEIAKFGDEDGNFSVKNFFNTGQLLSEGSYKQGKKHGIWKYYNRYGKLTSQFNYVDGMLQGKAYEYYASGEVQYEMEYRDDVLHGYFIEYYRHGPAKQEGWFQDGKREQQWLSYFANGTVEVDAYYLRGALTGNHYSYHQDGKLYSIAVYDSDVLKDLKNHNSKGEVVTVQKVENHVQSFQDKFNNGEAKAKYHLLCGQYTNDLIKWYPDGTVYYRYTFLDGNKEGRSMSNHPNGKLSSEGVSLNNKEDGIWKSYYYSGKLRKQGLYRDGLQDSVWNYYFADGTVSSTITYRNDKSHGISRYYSPEGTPLLEKLYFEGDLIAWRLINENVEDDRWVDFTGNATIVVTNSTGKVVYEETYVEGMRQGPKRLYYNNGKLHEEYRYVNGDFEGPFVVYFPDGKLQEKGNFKNDELHGIVETFNPDGTPYSIESFGMGTRHGKCTYFTGKGKLEYFYQDGVLE